MEGGTLNEILYLGGLFSKPGPPPPLSFKNGIALIENDGVLVESFKLAITLTKPNAIFKQSNNLISHSNDNFHIDVLF